MSKELVLRKYHFGYIITLLILSFIALVGILLFTRESDNYNLFIIISFIVFYLISLANMNNLSRFFSNEKAIAKYEEKQPKDYFGLSVLRMYIYALPIIPLFLYFLLEDISKFTGNLIAFNIMLFIINIIVIMVIKHFDLLHNRKEGSVYGRPIGSEYSSSSSRNNSNTGDYGNTNNYYYFDTASSNNNSSKSCGSRDGGGDSGEGSSYDGGDSSSCD